MLFYIIIAVLFVSLLINNYKIDQGKHVEAKTQIKPSRVTPMSQAIRRKL